jgi:hypothetical protein
LTPLAFAIVVSLVLIAPPVYAGMNTTELGLEESADINPEGSESTSEAQNELTNTDANETSTMPSDSNDTSEASTDNNVTGESLPPVSKKSQRTSEIVNDLGLDLSAQKSRVKIIFDSMQVKDNHEGELSGDGEYDISAYAQGKRVGLTDASGPGAGLWDVSNGETVTFDPGTEVTVELAKDEGLSIFTVGSEVDGCGRTSFPSDLPEVLEAVKPRPHDEIIPGIDPIRTIGAIQKKLNSGINWVGCKLNPNDDVGTINKMVGPDQIAYLATRGGKPTYTEYSKVGELTPGSNSDFILKFHLTRAG